jgi:transposase-like protein
VGRRPYHFNVRLEEARLCCLVIVGVRLDGTKELVAIADGLRESKDSWADLLRDLRRRGMRPPVVAVGDGALGFWAAVRDVWPETREARCWVHKNANVLDALPKAMHPSAKKMLAEIRDAANRASAVHAINAFRHEFGAKWPKAVVKIVDDAEPLLTFFDYPAEHWIHLKTTNPIVIWSEGWGVFDVAEERRGSRELRGGRAYLPPSSTQVRGRFGVRSAGGGARFAA